MLHTYSHPSQGLLKDNLIAEIWYSNNTYGFIKEILNWNWLLIFCLEGGSEEFNEEQDSLVPLPWIKAGHQQV